MRMSEKCRNRNNINNSHNPLTSRHTDGGKKTHLRARHLQMIMAHFLFALAKYE